MTGNNTKQLQSPAVYQAPTDTFSANPSGNRRGGNAEPMRDTFFVSRKLDPQSETDVYLTRSQALLARLRRVVDALP